MKILQLISSGGLYGAENMLVNLSVELKRLGHECVVGVFENLTNINMEVADRAETAGLVVRRIPCRSQLDWRVVGQLRQIVQENRIELLHAHGYKADFYGLLATRTNHIPVIATCHNWLERNLTMRAYARLDRYLLRFFDAVAAVSGPVADTLRRYGVRQRLHLIPNGVSVAATIDNARRGADMPQDDRVIVGTVGRLSKEKGHAFLIEAAAKIPAFFPGALFVVVGDGPLRRELSARVRDLGLTKQFLFTGQRRDMAQLYASFDLFVLPSLNEGMPMALLEAMAAGLPAVATKVGAVPDVISDSNFGTLVAPGDSDALASAIWALASDKRRRQEIGAMAKQRIEKDFSATAMAKRYVELYQRTLLRRQSPERSPMASPQKASRAGAARRIQNRGQ